MLLGIIKKCPKCGKFKLRFKGKYINHKHWVCVHCGFNNVGLNPTTVLKLTKKTKK